MGTESGLARERESVPESERREAREAVRKIVMHRIQVRPRTYWVSPEINLVHLECTYILTLEMMYS